VPVCPSVFVMTTSTVPTACAVVVPLIAVGVTLVTVSGEPPNDAVAPLRNPVPFTVTAVPPDPRPDPGVTDEGAGGARYVKQLLHVPDCASGFVTTTFTAPAACAVVVPVIAVAVTFAIVSADPPNDAVAPAWKPDPLTVTDVPPDVRPLEGETDETAGAGATYVKQFAHVPDCPSGFMTRTLAGPAACAAVVPVIDVGVIVPTVIGVPPSETVAPAWKLVPLTVTDVPPRVEPLAGAIPVTVGAGAGVPLDARSATCWTDQKFVALSVIVRAGMLPVTFVRLSAA